MTTRRKHILKLIPSPPARVESKNTKISGSTANSLISRVSRGTRRDLPSFLGPAVLCCRPIDNNADQKAQGNPQGYPTDVSFARKSTPIDETYKCKVLAEDKKKKDEI